MNTPLINPPPVKPLRLTRNDPIYILDNPNFNKEPYFTTHQKKCLKKGFCIVGSTVMYGGSIVAIGLLIYWQSIYPHTHN